MSSNLTITAMDAANTPASALARVQQALYIVLTSSEYQVIQ
jgi:hypothetical protein